MKTKTMLGLENSFNEREFSFITEYVERLTKRKNLHLIIIIITIIFIVIFINRNYFLLKLI